MNSVPLLHLKRQGSGPTLVLVHGVAGSSAIWQPIVPLLAKHFKVVQLDLLGYGHSPKPNIDYTPQLHVAAMHATLRHHHITTPFVMIGLSMGTLLTLEYAKTWPNEVRQLLCIGLPHYATADEARRRLRRSPWARLALEWGGLGQLIMRLAWGIGRRSWPTAVAFSRGRMYTPRMAHEATMSTPRAFTTSLLSGMVHNRAQPLLKATATIPQSYLHGALDNWVDAQAVQTLLSTFSHCDLTILPATHHNTVVFAPEATAAWIRKSYRHGQTT